MMQQLEAIDLRKERDFGDVINVTFLFLRQNLIPLGKSMLYIVGPAALMLGFVGAGMMAFMSTNPFESADPTSVNGSEIAAVMLFYMLLTMAGLATTVLALTVVNGYIVLYQDRGWNAVGVDDVWNVVKREFWGMLGTVFLVMGVLFGAYIGLIFPVVFIVVIGTTTGSSLAMGMLFALVLLAVIGVIMYLAVTCSLIFSVRMRESITATAALRRSFFLIKRNWWNTFLVVFISYLLMGILSLLFNLPQYALSFSGFLFSTSGEETPWFWWPLLIASIIGSLGSSLLYTVPMVATMVQYFNLVERKERKGLMDRIDDLNTGEGDPTHDSEHLF